MGSTFSVRGRFLLLAAWSLGFAPALAAGADPALPAYVAQSLSAEGSPGTATTMTIFGYNDMKDLLEPLVRRFSAAHPGLEVALDLPGTRFAPAALASGRAALAPMGATLTPPQREAYRAEAGHDPIEFRVAHASVDPRALSGPLGIFVHADNPVASLTLAQLASAYSGRSTRWGELGATGVWAERPVHLVGLQPGTALFHEMHEALPGAEPFATTMLGLPQSRTVVERVGADPLALGYAAAMRVTPRVRNVAVARDDAHAAVLPTEETITGGRYPLDRWLLIYARRPLTPRAREFMRLMLSREGQEAVAATPQHYLPLSAAEAAAERAKLDRP